MNPNKSKSGLTLVELMVSMSVLAIMSVGILSAVMQTRRMTEDSIYLTTATTVAQGYIEQIKAMTFSSLSLSSLPTIIDRNTPDALDVSPMVANPKIGDSNTDIVNAKLIDINNTPADNTDDMQMNIVVYVEDLTSTANGVGSARGITIRYQYVYSDQNRTHTYENTLSTIRSNVPNFF